MSSKDKNEEPPALPEATPPAEPPKKRAPRKKKAEKYPLPAFLETIFNFSGLIILIVAFSVAGIGFFSGVTLFQIFIRTAVSILATGALLLILVARVSGSANEAIFEKVKEENEKVMQQAASAAETEPEPTFEMKA